MLAIQLLLIESRACFPNETSRKRADAAGGPEVLYKSDDGVDSFLVTGEIRALQVMQTSIEEQHTVAVENGSAEDVTDLGSRAHVVKVQVVVRGFCSTHVAFKRIMAKKGRKGKGTKEIRNKDRKMKEGRKERNTPITKKRKMGKKVRKKGKKKERRK